MKLQKRALFFGLDFFSLFSVSSEQYKVFGLMKWMDGMQKFGTNKAIRAPDDHFQSEMEPGFQHFDPSSTFFIT